MCFSVPLVPLQAAVTVRHLMLPCSYPQRAGLLKDLVTSYGAGGRTIIFTDSKKEAAELSVVLGDSFGAQVRRCGNDELGGGSVRGDGVERTEVKQGVEPGAHDDPITYQKLTKYLPLPSCYLALPRRRRNRTPNEH